jgi:hypothetical protein
MNKIIETSTSTGTGNFTLAGAYNVASSTMTGNLPFSPRVINNLHVPYVIQDKLGNWEKGTGYLSSATTFVRNQVLDNSLGTMAKINFPAGEKIIFIPSEARALGSSAINNLNWITSPHSIGYKSGRAMVANVIYFAPHIQHTPMKVSAVGINVTALSAASQVRIGLYNITRQSDGGAAYDTFFPLAIDFGTVDSSSVGTKSITTDFYLPEGAYLFATISNGTPSVLAHNSQNVFNTVLTGVSGTMTDHIAMFQQAANAANFTALPATSFGALTASTNSNPPAVFLRGNAI